VPVDHEIAGLLQLLATVDKPLPDEGEAYARALAGAGVRVEVRRVDGLVHGFLDMVPLSGAAREAVEDTCRLFGEVLHP
jgi:acetyl esterase